jgi:hypothetical protein
VAKKEILLDSARLDAAHGTSMQVVSAAFTAALALHEKPGRLHLPCQLPDTLCVTSQRCSTILERAVFRVEARARLCTSYRAVAN